MTGQSIELRLSREWVHTSNKRYGRHKVAELNKVLRHYASTQARRLQPMAAADLVVTFTFPNRAARDVHNWMPTVKPLVDGLVHPHPKGTPGVLPDDNGHYLTGPDLREDRDHTAPHGVILARFDFTPREPS